MNTKWTSGRSNRAKMGSQRTHDGQIKTKCLSFRLHWSCESGWKYPNLVGQINVVSQSKKELQTQKMLVSTTKFTGERYEAGMLWSEPEPNLPNNYSSAWVTGAKTPKGPKPEEFVSTVNRYRFRIRFVKILNESEVKGTFGKEWYLPLHPVLTEQACKVRRVCNAASKYKEVCLNDQLLEGPDLLHRLIETIFRFREGPINLTADIESMLLQRQVPDQDRSCLRFLWRPRTNEPVQI